MISIINIFSIIFIGLFGAHLLVKTLRKIPLKINIVNINYDSMSTILFIIHILASLTLIGFMSCLAKHNTILIIPIILLFLLAMFSPMFLRCGLYKSLLKFLFYKVDSYVRLSKHLEFSSIDYRKVNKPSDRIIEEAIDEYIDKKGRKEGISINKSTILDEYKTIIDNSFTSKESLKAIVSKIEGHTRLRYTPVGWVTKNTLDKALKIKMVPSWGDY